MRPSGQGGEVHRDARISNKEVYGGDRLTKSTRSGTSGETTTCGVDNETTPVTFSSVVRNNKARLGPTRTAQWNRRNRHRMGFRVDPHRILVRQEENKINCRQAVWPRVFKLSVPTRTCKTPSISMPTNSFTIENTHPSTPETAVAPVSAGHPILDHDDSLLLWQPSEHPVLYRPGDEDDLTRYIYQGEKRTYPGELMELHQAFLRTSKGTIKVAAKIVRQMIYDKREHPKILKQLQHEIKIRETLDDPNIIPFFGTASGFPSPFCAMIYPWADNGNLTSYLANPTVNLTEEEVLQLIDDVACALNYLHSEGIVHGKLSGSNIVIDANGNAMLTDFGLTALLETLSESTSIARSIKRDKLRWAAPELLLVFPIEGALCPTRQSDSYSFGGVVYNILTKKVPYYDTDLNQIIPSIIRGNTPTRPDDPLVTDCRWDFIQQCWAPVDTRPCGMQMVAFSKYELGEHRRMLRKLSKL